MKRTKDELLNIAKKILGERTDDDALGFLEDMNDSILEGDDDWMSKYDEAIREKEELETEWRKKYRDRFFTPDNSHTLTSKVNDNSNEQKTDEEIEEEKLEQANKVSYDDLFKVKEN